MALIKCPECGKEVSSLAKACIHCGYPLDEMPEIKQTEATEKEFLTASPTQEPVTSTEPEAAELAAQLEPESPKLDNPPEPEVSHQPEKPKPPQKQTDSFKRGFIIVLLLIAIMTAAIIVAISLGSKRENPKLKKSEEVTSSGSTYSSKRDTSSSSSSTPSHTDEEAWYMAKYLVKQKLLSPSSAKFCDEDEAIITRMDDGIIVVMGAVEAENAYGVKIVRGFSVAYVPTENGASDYEVTFLD